MPKEGQACQLWQQGRAKGQNSAADPVDLIPGRGDEDSVLQTLTWYLVDLYVKVGGGGRGAGPGHPLHCKGCPMHFCMA